jgi:hypothetical protein
VIPISPILLKKSIPSMISMLIPWVDLAFVDFHEVLHFRYKKVGENFVSTLVLRISVHFLIRDGYYP